MDLSKMKNNEKLDLCAWYFRAGFCCLPFVWLVNAVWFWKEAFQKPPYDEQPLIRKYVIGSAIGALLCGIAIGVWVYIFQTNRVAWGEESVPAAFRTSVLACDSAKADYSAVGRGSPHWSMSAAPSTASSSLLIAAVRRRRPLWDPADVKHHDRVTVAGLWKQISAELGISTLLAKNKWRGLRDYYRQQAKRCLEQQRTGSGGTLSSSTWAHFEEMSFLRPTVAPPPHPVPVKTEPGSTGDEEEEVNTECSIEERWSWRPDPDDYLESQEDDDLLFFRSLLPDLRGLARSKKAWIRLQIQEVIFREVYGGGKSGEELPSAGLGPARGGSPPQLSCRVQIASDSD